jgi:ubiquinone/menaquinone biosynthesis C-methylase UbiE
MLAGTNLLAPTARLMQCPGTGLDGAASVLLAQARRTFAAPGDGLAFADIGCGTGLWADELGTQFPGATIYALDRDIKAYGRGLTLTSANVSLMECDIRKGLPFPDNSQDMILFNMVAPLLSNDELGTICQEISRVCKPLALIYVSNTHHELQALIGDRERLEQNETIERDTDPREDKYSLEKYLRGELVLPTLLRAAKIGIKLAADFQPPANSLQRFKEKSAKQQGVPFSCPSIRSYTCQNYKHRIHS